jgi:hypothetical protein
VVASFDPDNPSAIIVQDLKGERFFGVPLVPDVPAIADHDTLSSAAKETAAFNRVAKVRYSELAAKWRPKGRPVIVDPQAREKARSMEVARVAGRAQFQRNLDPRPISRLASEDPSLREFLTDTGRGDSLREVQNFLQGES